MGISRIHTCAVRRQWISNTSPPPEQLSHNNLKVLLPALHGDWTQGHSCKAGRNYLDFHVIWNAAWGNKAPEIPKPAPNCGHDRHSSQGWATTTCLHFIHSHTGLVIWQAHLSDEPFDHSGFAATALSVGFKHALGDPNGFLAHRLNHSAMWLYIHCTATYHRVFTSVTNNNM